MENQRFQQNFKVTNLVLIVDLYVLMDYLENICMQFFNPQQRICLLILEREEWGEKERKY